jgi:hypothetical protein
MHASEETKCPVHEQLRFHNHKTTPSRDVSTATAETRQLIGLNFRQPQRHKAQFLLHQANSASVGYNRAYKDSHLQT